MPFPRIYAAIERKILKKVVETKMARAIVRKGMPVPANPAAASAPGGFRGLFLPVSNVYQPVVLTPTDYLKWISFGQILFNAGGWYDSTYWSPPAGLYWFHVEMMLTLPVGILPDPEYIEMYIAGLDEDNRVATSVSATPHALKTTWDNQTITRYVASAVFSSDVAATFYGKPPIKWGVFVRLGRLTANQTVELGTGGWSAFGFRSDFQGLYVGPL